MFRRASRIQARAAGAGCNCAFPSRIARVILMHSLSWSAANHAYGKPMRFLVLVVLICTAPLLGAAARDATPATDFRWSAATADTFLTRFPDPDSIHWVNQANHFSWQAGYAMFTLEKLWRLTGDARYFNYVRRYVDQQVDEQGNIPGFVPDALDNFLPGYAILFLYEQTGLEKYKVAASRIRDGFRRYPRHCLKPNGLLLHGWDESRSASWADKRTGLAAEVWSEGLGWYAVLISDVFDYLPTDNPDRGALLEALRNLCRGLRAVQDPKTGMWCQVVDKPGAPGNWNETSGTGMYIYLIMNSIEKGYIDRAEDLPVVEKAYAGIIRKASVGADGLVDIHDCSSIGIQDNYEAYINSPKEVNPFAPVTSFILGTSIMEARGGRRF